MWRWSLLGSEVFEVSSIKIYPRTYTCGCVLWATGSSDADGLPGSEAGLDAQRHGGGAVLEVREQVTGQLAGHAPVTGGRAVLGSVEPGGAPGEQKNEGSEEQTQHGRLLGWCQNKLWLFEYSSHVVFRQSKSRESWVGFAAEAKHQ